MYECGYKMTVRDLCHAISIRHKCEYSFGWRSAHVFMGLTLIAVGLMYVTRILSIEYSEFTPMFLSMYLLLTLLGVILLFYKQLSILVQILQARKNGLFGREFLYRITDEGVISESLGTDATVSWLSFRSSGVGKHGIMLGLPNGLFHWLPKSGFASPEDWDVVSDLAKRRLPKIEY